jgi:hypothetical protein
VIQSQGESKASHLVRNNQDPHWNFLAEFFVIDVEGTVEVTIYDKSHSAGTEDEDKEWFKLDLRHSAQGKGPAAKDFAEPALVRLHLQWTKWIEEKNEGNGKTSVY